MTKVLLPDRDSPVNDTNMEAIQAAAAAINADTTLSSVAKVRAVSGLHEEFHYTEGDRGLEPEARMLMDALLFEEGDWDGLAQVRMGIDAVRDQLALEDDRDAEHALLINESEHNQ